MNPAAWLNTALTISLTLLAQAAVPAPKTPHDVRSFGAVGDGKTKDTAAFQKALEACAAGKGGEVVVPPGNYLIGSIVVPANTTLRIEKEATLTDSPDKEDYPLMDIRWEGRWQQGHRALIMSALNAARSHAGKTPSSSKAMWAAEVLLTTSPRKTWTSARPRSSASTC